MKFQVFRNGKSVSEFALSGAYLFGSDGIPVRGNVQIAFKDGVIECRKKNLEAAGLSLLWPVEGFGKIMLPTTRIPERPRPYILNLEIARAKLMQITIKREDWSLLEGSTEHAKRLEEAKDAFIRALQVISEPEKASLLADESLQKAVLFSENLTTAYADLLFNARRKTRGFGKYTVGGQINCGMIARQGYMEQVSEIAGYVTVPVNWREVEPEKGKYEFAAIDACIEALVKRKIAVGMGPLLRFSKECLPGWILEEKGGFEKIRETAYGFVTKMVSRYSKYVQAWRVISGMNALNHFGFSFEQILEMTRAATLAAKSANSKSIKMIEIVQPWGEYYAANPETVPPLVYVDMIIQSGISFDAFGVELLMGRNENGMHVRDLMHISAMLDRFVPLTKPLHITSVAVPDRCGTGTAQCGMAGIWRRQWDPELQAQWIEQFYKVALSKPFVETISYANFADNGSDLVPGSGLLDEGLKAKPAYESMRKLHKVIGGKQGQA